jgi:hypothetical protein
LTLRATWKQSPETDAVNMVLAGIYGQNSIRVKPR